jgi:hypothetical protein
LNVAFLSTLIADQIDCASGWNSCPTHGHFLNPSGLRRSMDETLQHHRNGEPAMERGDVTVRTC